jgi:hypothetical protein
MLDFFGRCTGHCCLAFFLPVAHEQHAEYDWSRVGPVGKGEGETIASMVVPLPEINSNRYTCQHVRQQADHFDCSIYEHRPEMCSAYPYGRTCEFARCTGPYTPAHAAVRAKLAVWSLWPLRHNPDRREVFDRAMHAVRIHVRDRQSDLGPGLDEKVQAATGRGAVSRSPYHVRDDKVHLAVVAV